MREIDVFIVRVQDGERMLPISAWVDPYHAKFEADRWQQDTKVAYDHIPGKLVFEDVPYVD